MSVQIYDTSPRFIPTASHTFTYESTDQDQIIQRPGLLVCLKLCTLLEADLDLDHIDQRHRYLLTIPPLQP
jgi:hypothetical protein